MLAEIEEMVRKFRKNLEMMDEIKARFNAAYLVAFLGEVK